MKRFLLRSLMSLVPPRYLPRLMYHLTEMSFIRWAAVDEDIFLEQGILSSSTCTDPNGAETELLEWIRTALKPGQVFYDIGANVRATACTRRNITGGRSRCTPSSRRRPRSRC